MFGDREQLVDENSKIRLTSLKKLGIKIERKVDMMVGRGKRRRYLTYSCGKIWLHNSLFYFINQSAHFKRKFEYELLENSNAN